MLKRYDIKSDRKTHEGWAIIVIDTAIGYFSTVSDYGNYAYIWGTPGMEFRKFLLGLNTDYLRGKLLHGRRAETQVFDGDATKAAIKQHLDEADASERECGGICWKWSAVEHDLLADRSFEDKSDFESWQSETRIDEPWTFGVWKPDPQATAFCEKVMPRFKKLLEEELEKEKTAAALLNRCPECAGPLGGCSRFPL